MNLTCKNQGFYNNSGGRIKSWNFRSTPNIVVHILKNQVNSYDSNGVIAVLISTLGDKKQNLPFFCSQTEAWQRMTDQNPEMRFTPHSSPLSGQNTTLGLQVPHHSGWPRKRRRLRLASLSRTWCWPNTMTSETSSLRNPLMNSHHRRYG